MQLLEWYRNRFAGQMFPSRLLRILQGEHSSVYVRNVVNGVMILSDNKVINCVENYYELPEGRKIKGGKGNQYLRCRQIRNAYNLDTVSNLDCIRCHIACLKAEKDGEMKRKPLRKKQ